MHGQERRQTEARHTMEVQNMRSDIERLKNQLEVLADERNDVYQLVRDVQSRLDAIEQSLGGFEAARASEKQELLDHLSRKIAEILKSQKPAPVSDTGYEHVVETGQTLSDIALAYKVNVKAIVQANNLPNANDITVGQKLFIPE